MARVFITGSSDGLGLLATRLLIEQGHEVVVHGRNDDRSRDALKAASGARGAVTGDLSTIAGARTVADQVNKLGHFDAVIHNAGIGYREGRVEMEPEVPSVFAVNVLAPYILTALIKKPDRLVYVSSGTHHGVRPRMDDLLWTRRAWSVTPGPRDDTAGTPGRCPIECMRRRAHFANRGGNLLNRCGKGRDRACYLMIVLAGPDRRTCLYRRRREAASGCPLSRRGRAGRR